MVHPGLWHPIGGFGVLWRHLAVPSIMPTLARLQRVCDESPGPVVVFASPLAVGARIAAEVFPHIRLTTGHTAPAGLRSCEDPMFLGARQIPVWVPRWVRRQVWQWLDDHKLDRMAAPKLNSIRSGLGLPPIKGPVFGAWLHSSHRVITMFPSEFGPMPADWPVTAECVGFPLYEQDARCDFSSDDPITSNNERADLIFYIGSASTRQARHMLDTALSLSASGRTCLLLGPLALAPTATVRNFKSRSMAHLPSTLSKATCFIHHGGIGSIAQGFAAGVPQVAVASAYDQFDNAWRLRKVGNQAGRASSLIEEIALAESSWQVTEKSLQNLQFSTPNQPNTAVLRIVDRLIEDSRA